MVIGHCLTHHLVIHFLPLIQDTLTGVWKIARGENCGNCVCTYPEFAPLPELLNDEVSESELTAFDEAQFTIHWELSEEEAQMRLRASLSNTEISWALLRAKYL